MPDASLWQLLMASVSLRQSPFALPVSFPPALLSGDAVGSSCWEVVAAFGREPNCGFWALTYGATIKDLLLARWEGRHAESALCVLTFIRYH